MQGRGGVRLSRPLRAWWGEEFSVDRCEGPGIWVLKERISGTGEEKDIEKVHNGKGTYWLPLLLGALAS
jgi:hypothetical protein